MPLFNNSHMHLPMCGSETVVVILLLLFTVVVIVVAAVGVV